MEVHTSDLVLYPSFYITLLNPIWSLSPGRFRACLISDLSMNHSAMHNPANYTLSYNKYYVMKKKKIEKMWCFYPTLNFASRYTSQPPLKLIILLSFTSRLYNWYCFSTLNFTSWYTSQPPLQLMILLSFTSSQLILLPNLELFILVYKSTSITADDTTQLYMLLVTLHLYYSNKTLQIIIKLVYCFFILSNIQWPKKLLILSNLPLKG